MPTTPNTVVNDVGLLEIQQTAAIQLAFTTLNVLDNDTWIDITKMLVSLDPGSPGDKAVTSQRNASQKKEMRSISSIVGAYTPKMTLYDTNGVATDHGTTAPFDLKDLLLACRDNTLELPLRYSIKNAVGDNIHTYVTNRILSVAEKGIDTSSNNFMTLEVNMDAEDRTTAKVT